MPLILLKPSQSPQLFERIQLAFPDKRILYIFTRQSLENDLVQALYQNHDELFGRNHGKRQPELVAILDSSGGSAHAAYLMARFLRLHCSRLIVVVPATLICLAADEIVLTDISELGPLDPQIRRPGETVYRPALDEYTSLDALRQETIKSLDIIMPLLMERTLMDVKDLIGPVSDFVARFMSPVYSQVNPFLYGAHMRALKVSKEYAIRLLNLPKQYKECAPKVVRSPNDIAERLTTAYPCHDFILDLPELDQLGLPVRHVTENEEEPINLLTNLSRKVDLIGTYESIAAQTQPIEPARQEVATAGQETDGDGAVVLRPDARRRRGGR